MSEFSKRKYYVNDHSCTAPHPQVQQNEKHLIFTKRKQKAPLLRIRTGTLTSQARPWSSVCPTEHKIGYTQNDSKLTSIGNIEFDSKISIGSSWVVAGCQNDPTNGFDLSNDAGYSRGGEDSILSNNQATNLGEEIQNTHFNVNKSRATAQKCQNSQMDKEIFYWTRKDVL